MKLELKHLAPYLPYGLQMIFDGKGGRVITLTGITNVPNLGIAISNGNGSMWLHSSGFIPILNPLLDLIKDIEHEGQTIKPLDYIATSTKGKQSIMRRVAHGLKLDNLEYWQIERLFELHFDVFNLIPEGLAIDATTLKAAV